MDDAVKGPIEGVVPVEGPLPVEAPVDEVLLMEDRAQVTRAATVELPSGRRTLRLADITPLVADRTVRCRVARVGTGSPAGDGARLMDLHVLRRYRVRTSRPEKEQEITKAIEGLVGEYLGIYDRASARFRERGVVEQATGAMGRHISDRLVVGPFDEKWAEDVRLLWERRAEVERAILDDQWKLDDEMRRIRRLEEERRQALQPVAEYCSEIVTELMVAEAGSYRVSWEYHVPCALWRPDYVAELAGQSAAASVRWQSAGAVWQNTGEDWPSVTLRFSTARPSLGAALPLLADDVLQAREKTVEEKKTIDVVSRDEEIAHTATAPQEKKSDTPPGLDDGGETRTYTAPVRVSVPADGRFHRVPFEEWTAPAECDSVCTPEKARFVFLRSMQTNASRLPLLAGPVTLVRNGGFSGRSQISFVAQGERFGLSWGSDDDLTVLRDVTKKQDEVGLRKQHLYRYEVRVVLFNYSESSRTVKLTERVPVSEIDQVEVALEREKTSAGFQMDAQGLVTWTLDIAPGLEKRIDLAYSVKMPSNVSWEG